MLAAPGTRGVGGEGSRKYSALEGDGNQYWPVHSSILAWRTPSDREAWQATVYRVAKNQTGLDEPCVHKHKTFFFFLIACGSSAPVRVEHESGIAAWLVGP